jgi:hypothetical protein
MNTILQFLLRPTEGPHSVLLVRVAVGLIFFTPDLCTELGLVGIVC